MSADKQDQVVIGEYKRCTDRRVLDLLMLLEKYQDLCAANTIKLSTALTLAKDLMHCEFLLAEAMYGKEDAQELLPARVYVDLTRAIDLLKSDHTLIATREDRFSIVRWHPSMHEGILLRLQQNPNDFSFKYTNVSVEDVGKKWIVEKITDKTLLNLRPFDSIPEDRKT